MQNIWIIDGGIDNFNCRWMEWTFCSWFSVSYHICPNFILLINDFAYVSNDKSTKVFTLTHAKITSFAIDLHLKWIRIQLSRNEQKSFTYVVYLNYLDWPVYEVIDYNITRNTVHTVRYIGNCAIEMGWILFTIWTSWSSMKDECSGSETIKIAQQMKHLNDQRNSRKKFHSEWNVKYSSQQNVTQVRWMYWIICQSCFIFS